MALITTLRYEFYVKYWGDIERSSSRPENIRECREKVKQVVANVQLTLCTVK